MKLQKRIDRLEEATAKPANEPCAIVRTILQPSASGPLLVAGLARRKGEPWRHIDREPGEALEAFTARLDLECST